MANKMTMTHKEASKEEQGSAIPAYLELFGQMITNTKTDELGQNDLQFEVY
jgi:hypothetical protein